MFTQKEIKEILETYVNKYNTPDFIENDPISIPHFFSQKEDIEIAAFLTSAIAWGNRKSIIKSAKQLVSWMENSPYDFILNAKTKDFSIFRNFKYRTFNGEDCIFFMQSLQNIYLHHKGLEAVFNDGFAKGESIKEAINYFRKVFFSVQYPQRTQKHIANPMKKSAAKRINMFLRWIVRNDSKGVDFGIWKKIPTSDLMLPLDVHSGRFSREFQLLKRKQNDWLAVEEVTHNLKGMDNQDPIKYDFALFGMGVDPNFKRSDLR